VSGLFSKDRRSIEYGAYARRNAPAPITKCEHESSGTNEINCRCPCVRCFDSKKPIGFRCIDDRCLIHALHVPSSHGSL
jgi:hypothetical protein